MMIQVYLFQREIINQFGIWINDKRNFYFEKEICFCPN